MKTSVCFGGGKWGKKRMEKELDERRQDGLHVNQATNNGLSNKASANEEKKEKKRGVYLADFSLKVG